MLTVLWVTITVGVLVTTSAVVGRQYFDAARYRVDWQRAFWKAAGCERKAQAAIDSLLRDSVGAAADAWRTLPTHLRNAPQTNGCSLALEAAGTRLDANSASRESISRLFAALPSITDGEELATAFVAARDTLPFADVRDFIRARGFVTESSVVAVLSVEPGRVSLATAGENVLGSIPGISDRAARQIIDFRNTAGPLSSLAQLFDVLGPTESADLAECFADATIAATVDPDAWIVRSVAETGWPPVRAVLEWRFVRVPSGVRVARAGVIG